MKLMLRQQLDQPAVQRGPGGVGTMGAVGAGSAPSSVVAAAAAAVRAGAVSPAKKDLHTPR